ncbi:LETM1 domain-containing protein 1 isoform X2 [Gopherus evgoodei]|uniref:LETM1 domain containing 1 n=1 Tax=Gopherus evgoodei TaxID=1825980 RepID=A0A8C4YDR5_9SAUR|nr:LETM1 domain-containing protein 1 isoform X2 [Gopherus evgoodei]
MGRPRLSGGSCQSALGPAHRLPPALAPVQPRDNLCPLSLRDDLCAVAKMALSRLGCGRGGLHGGLLGVGPVTVPASWPRRVLRAPEPVPAWRALRHPACCLSTKTNPKAILAAVVSQFKYANGKYESFLERTFPRFYVLYSTFLKGCRTLFSEAKEIRRIKLNMSLKKIDFHQLPYREMERLRQFRRDLIKAIPIGLLALPPFANYLIFLLMYLFPRQLLIRHFWTPKQQFEFLNIYHGMRREVYPEIIDGLEQVTRFIADQQLRDQMQELCTKVQSGSHPEVAKLLAVRSLFVGHPLGLQRLRVWQVKALSRVLFLTPHLPIFVLRYRLRSHMLELQHLDQAMLKLGVSELSEEEVKMACYVRGLNSTHLSSSECQKWLKQWAKLSCELKDSEVSLLAHSMVLLSTNYLGAKE